MNADNEDAFAKQQFIDTYGNFQSFATWLVIVSDGTTYVVQAP